MNKYQTWYQNITDRAQNRNLVGYTERHHVIPRSLGGSDTADNLVDLTAREHFICHWLLVKMNTGEHRAKMVYALRMMRAEKSGQFRYNTKLTSRVYESIKQEYRQIQSKKMIGENNPMWGKARTPEMNAAVSRANTGDQNGAKRLQSRQKIKDSKLGKKRNTFSQEWLDNMSKAHIGEKNGMYNKKHTDEAKSKQREKAIGRKQSAETIQKKADAVRGSKREKKLCPHCDQQIAVNTYPRFHGDNCKHRT